MPEHFIAPDAHDEPTLWRTNGEHPVAVVTAREIGDPDVWDVLAAHYGGAA